MTRGSGTSGPSKSDDSGRLPSFAIVVPMYNEQAGATRCVEEIVAVLSTSPNRTSLIVVDDGSQDGTSALLAGLVPQHPALDIVSHPVNRGYGAALVSGAARAAALSFDYVLFMDSDLTNDPRDIPRFAAKMGEGADVIKATRYTGGGGMVGVPWRRALISRVGNRIARVLFRLPLADCTNGFRAVRTALLTRMALRERGFPVIMEELYWCRFLTRSFAEVPVTLTNAGRASSFRYRPSVFVSYLRYPWRAFLGRAPMGRGNVGQRGE
jgi:dolichol-phosphate mannosyltransferase